jgi:hypothetical protein
MYEQYCSLKFKLSKMKTGNSVPDGTLSDEKLGKLFRRTNEIKRRIEEGTILYSDAIDVMQLIIERKSRRALIFSNPPKWKVWKCLDPISLDAMHIKTKLLLMCKEEDNYSLELLSRFPYLFDGVSKHFSLDLVKTSVSELGFDEGATIGEVRLRAQNLGLKLCHPSVAYWLRLDYPDQEKKELLEIGMNPIITPEYKSVAFQIENYKNPRIGFESENEMRLCFKKDIFIFQI